MKPISHTLERLAAGEQRSRDLVEACLHAIEAGEGSRAFRRTFAEAARAAADRFDQNRPAGLLAGLPISIKDLFDVAGEQTTAGSTVLANASPASKDSVAVARLRAAGAILIGSTNMTEFAFSGLGVNPHFGTPANAWDRPAHRIPGGSSSGAAVSVTDGMAHAALGTDTGGSVRIPAALCGLTGFKPTARRISLKGCLPLSPTLDSAGPIAPTVACCARIDAVLAGESSWQPQMAVSLKGTRLGVLQGYVLDGLDMPVSHAFAAALKHLSRAGAQVQDVTFAALDNIPEANRKGGFAAAEAYAWHRSLLETQAGSYDPRVSSRILRGRDMTAADYIDLLDARRAITAEAARCFAGYDAILLPTVPRVAPRLSDLAADAAYFEANAAMLRNPSVFNFLDGCALSLPCHRAGEPPVGLMIAGLAMQDARVLAVGAAVEAALAVGLRADSTILA